MSEYEPTIGLEVHAELNTRTKLFCGCLTRFGSPQNTQTCPVCIGMPGALPVMNKRAFEMALRAAISFDCEVKTRTVFDRKNYYYPDLPKNYQISQNYNNLGVNGRMRISVNGKEKEIGITNVHLEEDAGKSLHPEGSGTGKSMIDLNRAGRPLLEIVSAPDMHSVEEANVFMHAIRNMLLYLDVSTCRMEQGVLRFEASISLAPAGSRALGNRVEIKNLNSMKTVQKALKYEITRQTKILSGGGEVPSETLLWNEVMERSEAMRSKELAQDYRYFPEPDLVPVVMDRNHIETIARKLPEMPLARRGRFVSQYALPEYDADLLVQDRAVADYFERAAEACGDPKAASNWIMTSVLSDLNQKGMDAGEFAEILPPESLAEIIKMVADGTTNIVNAREIYAEAFSSRKPPRQVLEEKGLTQISDDEELSRIVDAVIEENPQAVSDFAAGKKQAAGFLMGQVMRKTRGKANPELVNGILRKKLG